MIDKDFNISTDQFRLTFTGGTRNKFFIRSHGRAMEIIYPPQTDFAKIQPWLFKVITEILRKQAKVILPERLHELAALHGFQYTRVSINSARTRWGSCSGKKHINLSLYLMILPQKLSDYVLLHELCHTCEMNHGPRFWNLMDEVTGQQAKTLRQELRNHPSPFR